MQLKRNKEMKFEILKKSHKKQIIIGALAICIVGGALTFATSRARYKLTEDIELAKGTINYIPYDFKVTAMYQSDDKTNYTEIKEMPGKNYKINEDKSYCTINNVDKDSNAKIHTNKYGEHIIEKLQQTEKCYVYFDKNTEIVNTALGNIEVNNYTPDFSKIAEYDEGIFKAEDNDGVSYYWRGATTTNYLKFGGFCWRIIRINGDGTIRLIYDGTTCHQNGEVTIDSIAVQNVAYNTLANRSEYVGWTYVEGKQRPEVGDTAIDSNAKTKTEEWYNTNLTSYNDKIADGKYCNDRNTGLGGTTTAWNTTDSVIFYYAIYSRMYLKTPTFNCSNDDVYMLKVGLLMLDETMYAGGGLANNNLYYLYNGQEYWTMSPNAWWIGSTSVSYIGINGYLDSYLSDVNRPRNIRPVINLKSDITISNGNGTLNNPYIVQ